MNVASFNITPLELGTSHLSLLLFFLGGGGVQGGSRSTNISSLIPPLIAQPFAATPKKR